MKKLTDNNSIETSTKRVLNILTINKLELLRLNEERLEQLKEQRDNDPENKIIEYRYFWAKSQYEQVKRTVDELLNLEQEIRFSKSFRKLYTLEAS